MRPTTEEPRRVGHALQGNVPRRPARAQKETSAGIATRRRTRVPCGAMTTYEFVCLACEHPFEQRRPMGGGVDTALVCPSCGSDRLRRRFSFFTTGGGAASGQAGGRAAPAASGGCACGGACACGG